MIPEYKLYHGAVICELIDVADFDLSIRELKEEGRLSSYVLNDKIGLHIKHSTARLPPWQFTITRANLLQMFDLVAKYRTLFVAFVCGTDGIAVLSVDEIVSVIETSGSNQAWVRMDRSRRQKYSVSGNKAVLGYKKAKGIAAILDFM